jgi:hypothetical protein
MTMVLYRNEIDIIPQKIYELVAKYENMKPEDIAKQMEEEAAAIANSEGVNKDENKEKKEEVTDENKEKKEEVTDENKEKKGQVTDENENKKGSEEENKNEETVKTEEVKKEEITKSEETDKKGETIINNSKIIRTEEDSDNSDSNTDVELEDENDNMKKIKILEETFTITSQVV